MLVCVVLISPLLNFVADKVDSLATLDVQGGPVCCASSTSSPQQCFYALLNHLGGHFVMSSLVIANILAKYLFIMETTLLVCNYNRFN